MKKPDALLVAPEAPYPVMGGGPARTASLVEYLGRRYALDVIVFREPGAADPAAAFPAGLPCAIRVIELPYHSRSLAARAARNLRRFLRGRSPLNDRFSGFEDEIERCLRGRSYELAVVEHFWCASYAERIAAHARTLVLDLHNVESVLYRRAAETEAWPMRVAFGRFAAACERLERRWLPRYSWLLAASPDDARRVAEIAPGCRCEVYPNAIPLAPRPQRAEEHLVAFSGNWEYHPNQAAVRFFRREIWPRLRTGWPELRWRLIGRNPEGVRKYAADDPRIELGGAVADAVRELAAAQVVVAPMLAGSGTRVKIIEAWAAARAVVWQALSSRRPFLPEPSAVASAVGAAEVREARAGRSVAQHTS